MAVCLKLDDLSVEQRLQVTNDLSLKTKETEYDKEGKDVFPFRVVDDRVYLPFDYANGFLKTYPNDSNKYHRIDVKFNIPLRETQVPVVKEAIEALNKRRRVFLALHTGFGKTMTAIYISSKIGLKALFVIHRVLLIEQWIESAEKACPGVKVQLLTAKNKMDPDAHFYIINALTIMKRNPDDYKGIGTCVFDECHALCSEKVSKCMLWLCPRFLIGLSATPDERSDGMSSLIDLHFGKDRIIKPLKAYFEAYRLPTGMKIPFERNYRGKTDWNSVLNNQCLSKERNDLILDVVRYFKDRVILVISKRIEQVKYIYDELQKDGDDVEILTGSKKKYNYNCRVLLSTYSKSGVGFDNKRLNMMIIASDVSEFFKQYLGRIFRGESKGVHPIVVDVVDSEPSSLQKHWQLRRLLYLETGAEKIHEFWKSFPDFPTFRQKENKGVKKIEEKKYQELELVFED